MRKLICLALILLGFKSLLAQEAAANQPFKAGAGFGYSNAGYRDEVESPINRYYNAFFVLLDGTIEKDRLYHSFNINFLKGSPESSDPYTGYYRKHYISVKGFTEYALDYRLWGNDTLPGFFGAAIRTGVHYTGSDGNSEDSALPTGFGMISLDAHISQKWIINTKNMCILSAGYPIVGYTIRPAYTGMDELWARYLFENPLKIIALGEITSFHNYWAFFGDLKYYYRHNRNFSTYAGLGFEFSRINFPRPRTDLLFRINAGIAASF